jgi:hypothetical protein
MPSVEHRRHNGLNNCAENSHQPTRRRDRQMKRFKLPEQAQRFLSAHSMIYGHFRPRRLLMAAGEDSRARNKASRPNGILILQYPQSRGQTRLTVKQLANTASPQSSWYRMML